MKLFSFSLRNEIEYKYLLDGLPSGSVVKESACNAEATEDVGSIPGSGRSPGGGSPVFFPGESHGQRSLVGYGP